MREDEFDELLAKSSLGTPAARRARDRARLSDIASVYNRLRPRRLEDCPATTVTPPAGSMQVSTPIGRLAEKLAIDDRDAELADVVVVVETCQEKALLEDMLTPGLRCAGRVADNPCQGIADSPPAAERARNAWCHNSTASLYSMLGLAEYAACGDNGAALRAALITAALRHQQGRDTLRRLWEDLYRPVGDGCPGSRPPRVEVVDVCHARRRSGAARQPGTRGRSPE